MSIVKLAVTLIAVSLIIAILKKNTTTHNTKAVKELTKSIENSTDTSYYFIGSSRVQKSIDPNILSKAVNGKSVFNLGISNSLFLSNCFLADFVMEQKGEKIIFIELSALNEHFPKSYTIVANALQINSYSKLWSYTKNYSITDKVKLFFSIINQQLFSAFSIKIKAIRFLNYNKKEVDKTKLIGYCSSKRAECDNTTSILSRQDLINYSDERIDHRQYFNLITQLLEKSKTNHSKIFFFLPITMQK